MNHFILFFVIFTATVSFASPKAAKTEKAPLLFRVVCAEGSVNSIANQLNAAIIKANVNNDVLSVSAPTFSNASQAQHRNTRDAAACVTITQKEKK